MSQHTPTPWRIDQAVEHRIENQEGYTITWVSGADASVNVPNAEFIVRACNAHEELLAAAMKLANHVRCAPLCSRRGGYGYCNCGADKAIQNFGKLKTKAEARP